MSLLEACVLAFVVVFVLLAFLALAMHWITLMFPERKKGPDVALAAATAGAVATAIPGARVTKIEEES